MSTSCSMCAFHHVAPNHLCSIKHDFALTLTGMPSKHKHSSLSIDSIGVSGSNERFLYALNKSADEHESIAWNCRFLLFHVFSLQMVTSTGLAGLHPTLLYPLSRLNATSRRNQGKGRGLFFTKYKHMDLLGKTRALSVTS